MLGWIRGAVAILLAWVGIALIASGAILILLAQKVDEG